MKLNSVAHSQAALGSHCRAQQGNRRAIILVYYTACRPHSRGSYMDRWLRPAAGPPQCDSWVGTGACNARSASRRCRRTEGSARAARARQPLKIPCDFLKTSGWIFGPEQQNSQDFLHACNARSLSHSMQMQDPVPRPMHDRIATFGWPGGALK
eukprot:COSAG01_NODE_2313_length_7933_cov_79.874777_7_plen_154_part_00